MNNEQIREQVTTTILAALESGVSPWRRPWNTTGGAARPHNAASGHVYSGINTFYLWAVASAQGYGTSQWLTYNQARGLNGNVKRGEKAAWIVFAKPLRVKAKASESADSDGFKKLFLMRVTPVFNVAQCENLELPSRELPEELSDHLTDADIVRKSLTFARDVGISVELGGNRACFSVEANAVRMPEPAQFHSAEAFAATLYHEVIHATGHTSRLSRKFGGRFGDADYAFEELIAELGSAMLCQARGIGSDQMESHAAYIDNWRAILEANPKAIFDAAKFAEAALNFLIPAETIEHSEEIAA